MKQTKETAVAVLRWLIPHSPRAMLATLVALPTLQIAVGGAGIGGVRGGGDVCAVWGGLGEGV